MFALPLVNIHKVKSWLFQLKLRDDNQPTLVKNSLCAVCNEAPTLPQETNCHHIFCYYCLKVIFHTSTIFSFNLEYLFHQIGKFGSRIWLSVSTLFQLCFRWVCKQNLNRLERVEKDKNILILLHVRLKYGMVLAMFDCYRRSKIKEKDIRSELLLLVSYELLMCTECIA